MVDWAQHTARAIKSIGREVTVIPAVLPARKVMAVFTSTPETVLDVDSISPILRLALADATGIERGDAVQVGTTEYRIVRLRPDGDAGDVVVTLQAA